MINAVRTPEDRFVALPGWTFEPSYIDDLPGYEGLRLAYVDEGPRDAPVFLCLHGEPSWGYLYRKMAPVFLEAGCRVVIPDLLGFGRSDKPVDDAVYTFHWHRNYLKAFIERLDLHDVALVCQDWGGLLGLTLPMDYPDRFKRLIVMNTGLGVGSGASDGFMAWRDYMANTPDLDVGALLQRATPGMTDDVAQAYSAPFPDSRYKAGVRRFPALVPITAEMEGVDTGKAAAKFCRKTGPATASWRSACRILCWARTPWPGCAASFAAARSPWRSPRRAISCRSMACPSRVRRLSASGSSAAAG